MARAGRAAEKEPVGATANGERWPGRQAKVLCGQTARPDLGPKRVDVRSRRLESTESYHMHRSYLSVDIAW
jgi:hypothetical protein